MCKVKFSLTFKHNATKKYAGVVSFTPLPPAPLETAPRMLSGLQNKYGHFGEEKDPALSSDVAWWRRERSNSIQRCSLEFWAPVQS